jgi:hypothetical protein
VQEELAGTGGFLELPKTMAFIDCDFPIQVFQVKAAATQGTHFQRFPGHNIILLYITILRGRG